MVSQIWNQQAIEPTQRPRDNQKEAVKIVEPDVQSQFQQSFCSMRQALKAQHIYSSQILNETEVSTASKDNL